MTSLYNTGQQWDAPNAWPNLQYFIVEGLMAYSSALFFYFGVFNLLASLQDCQSDVKRGSICQNSSQQFLPL